MTEKHLNIDHVSIVFDTPAGPFKALDNVDLLIAKGEYVSLIGHSGCGKSTVLNIVAGLLKATTGGVVLDGTEVDEPVLLSDRIVMMTNGPAATIGEILDIELERPRGRVELADSAEYNHYRAAVLKFLYERQRNPESGSNDGVPVKACDSSDDKKLQVVSNSAAA